MKSVISKLLGYAIILGSILVKLPQILKIVSSKRIDSLAPSMYILENIGYTIVFGYNFRQGYPFSTYGENIFLLIQGILNNIIYINRCKK
jgi:mannose-P-dolichol utilization defect protein 1